MGGHCVGMSDLPFTPEDERAWVDDEPESADTATATDAGTDAGNDETDRIDARVLSESSERDALDQRRTVELDDDR